MSDAMPLIDLIAVLWFVISWLIQSVATEIYTLGGGSLSQRMAAQRRNWMRQMGNRDVRIVDTQIMNSLQNGTAFFASTSLIAIGGIFSLFNASDKAMAILQDLPFAGEMTRTLWDIKILGLILIYAYTFFKFGWAYRLFNYTSILIGAVPPFDSPDAEARTAAVERAAALNIEAGKHFNRGLRVFFLAIGYLGWFVNGWMLIATTTFLLVILLRRQYFSAARGIVAGEYVPEDNES